MSTGVFASPDESEFESLGRGRPAPPNIVFILADDLGWADLGCYGSTEIHTPHIDRLAAQGVRFTHGYAASPWCSAMRFGLYTGRYPSRIQAGLHEPLQIHSEENGIPDGHPTLPSLLADAGYDTAMFGKWHCGWMPWFSPLKIGFQKFFGNLGGALDYFEHFGSHNDADLWEGETPVQMVGYYTDMISQRSVEYIAAEHAKPFYLQVNYTAPHWPWQGRDDAHVSREIWDAYEEGVFFPLRQTDGGSLAKYAELVEAMDDGVGQILDSLAEAGVAENTIVIFSSDNGGERWSKSWPFVGQKGDITEGGIRVPFILRWPDEVGAGQVCAEPSITMDWTATFLDAAGTAPHDDFPLDGVSLLPWLTEAASYPQHDLFWRIASQSAMRRGPLKYVQSGRPRPVSNNWPMIPGDHEMLYDVTVDGREAADIIRHHPNEVAAMRAELDKLNAELLPYPPDHRNAPLRAAAAGQTVSHPD